jgi:hypothetical protein
MGILERPAECGKTGYCIQLGRFNSGDGLLRSCLSSSGLRTSTDKAQSMINLLQMPPRPILQSLPSTAVCLSAIRIYQICHAQASACPTGGLTYMSCGMDLEPSEGIPVDPEVATLQKHIPIDAN